MLIIQVSSRNAREEHSRGKQTKILAVCIGEAVMEQRNTSARVTTCQATDIVAILQNHQRTLYRRDLAWELI